jgi:hydroxymethylpyrimidine pyrophosphatase-like HAD family hydrolase
MIIAIDFDGTIVEHDFPRIGKLREGARDAICNLYFGGHIIIIWTCRDNLYLSDMILFLDKNDIPYHAVNKNADCLTFDTGRKIYADVYIDDRNIGGVLSWREIYHKIAVGEK